MGKAWLRKRRSDRYYRAAKREGFRSRAAYKLLQMDERFELFYEGDTVIDLGASPGGWSQVAKGLVGDGGRVVAVDTVSALPSCVPDSHSAPATTRAKAAITTRPTTNSFSRFTTGVLR